MRLACHQPHYLAWPGHCHKMASCDAFVYLDEVQYKPREFQNRNRVKTPSGWMWLSVPVLTRGRRGQKIGAVETVRDRDWAAEHLETLRLYYGKAHAFEEHEPFLEVLYGRRWRRLMDLCLEWDRHLAKALGAAPLVLKESEVGSEGAGTRRIISLCRRLGLSESLRVKDASKGALGKLAWVCAAGHDPDVYLLDEPTSGLDALVRDDLLTSLVE